MQRQLMLGNLRATLALDRVAQPRGYCEPLRGWGIQFTVRRATRHVCTDLPEVTSTIAPIACPFTGEELMAVPALKPDVAISRKGRERT